MVCPGGGEECCSQLKFLRISNVINMTGILVEDVTLILGIDNVGMVALHQRHIRL